jgi:hypothetical protein
MWWKPAELFVFTAIRSARWPRRFSLDFTATLRLRPIGLPSPLLAPFGAPRRAPAEKAVDVGVVLLALRQKRQLPRALLTGTHQRRTFHRRWLPARFRRVVFRAHCVVDWAPNHTAEKWAEWATAIWGTISTYWRGSHARRGSFRVKGKNQSFRRRAPAQKIERLIIWCFHVPVPGTRKSISNPENHVNVCLL